MIPFAGFDVNLQAGLGALTRTLEGALAALLAQGQTNFQFPLPAVGGLALGTLDVTINGGHLDKLTAVGTARQEVQTDFDIDVTLGLTGGPVTFQIAVDVPFDGVDLSLDTTPQGIPDALKIGLAGAQLGTITPQPGAGALSSAAAGLLNLITPILNAGIRIITTLVQSVPIIVKPLIDAFSLLGLQLHHTGNPATSSPFITAFTVPITPRPVAPLTTDVLVVATDFERQSPPPVGNPAALVPFISQPNAVAVTLDTGVINQGIDLAIGHGFLPSVFPAAGFTFHIINLGVELLGPAAAAQRASQDGFPAATFINPQTQQAIGAIEVIGELRGKRGSCWCKVKVAIAFDVLLWPFVDVTGAPIPPAPLPGALAQRQQNVHLRSFFDVSATVTVSGYLIMLIDLIFGPILVPLLFLVSQIANAVIKSYLPYTRTISGGGTSFQLTASSASINAYLTWALDFNVSAAVQGQGDLVLDEFTGFTLPINGSLSALPIATQNLVDIKVDYAADSLTIDDGVIELQATIAR